MKRSFDNIDVMMNKKPCIDIADLTCPITKEIFCIPVLADDGFTYEKWAIEKHMDSGMSPITRKPIKTCTENVIIKNMVNRFIEENPTYKSEQFPSSTYYDFSQNKKQWIKLLSHGNFEEFSKFNDIRLLEKMSNSSTVIENLCKTCTNVETFKRIISKSVDIHCSIDNKTPMYYVASSKNKNIIIAAIDIGMYNISKDINENFIKIIKTNKSLNDDEKLFIFNHIITNNHFVKIFIHNPSCIFDINNNEGLSDNIILQIISDPMAMFKLIDIDILPKLYLDDAIIIFDKLEHVTISFDDVHMYYKEKYGHLNVYNSINSKLKCCYDVILGGGFGDDEFKKKLIAKFKWFYKDKIMIDTIDDALLREFIVKHANVLADDVRSCTEFYDGLFGQNVEI